jgi:kumamolisin
MLTRTPLWLLSSTSLAALLLAVAPGVAQQAPQLGQLRLKPGYLVMGGSQTRPLIVDPASGQQKRPGFANTNVKIAVPQGGLPQVKPLTAGPPYTGYLYETPASLACVYGTVLRSSGCNPNIVTTLPAGGSKAIAIVDALDYGAVQAAADLATFDTQFGVAPAHLTVIYGTGNPANGCVNGPQPPPSAGTGWDVEEAVDMETTHAMAPNAQIYLVEANSSSISDLFNAVQVATACVQAAGGGQVTMSWGSTFEFSGETAYDKYLTGTHVTYLASAGDSPGPSYPASSPNVIGVGGTTFSRDLNGNFLGEVVWNDDYEGIGTGGGPSFYEPRPAYQNVIETIVGNARGTPDLAALGDPITGAWIYNVSGLGGWSGVAGTSLSAPLLAGILNEVNFFFGSPSGALTTIYGLGQAGTIKQDVTFINSGVCGPSGLVYSSYGVSTPYPNSSNPPFDPQNTLATTGIPWNFCTGWGSPKDAGKPNALRGPTTVSR